MCRQNAKEETYENVTVPGIPMLFTCLSTDRDTVPKGYYLYEVRHDDDQRGDPVQIGKRSMANHWGTLISSCPMKLRQGPGIHNACRDIDPEQDWNDEGTASTLPESMGKCQPEKEKNETTEDRRETGWRENTK